MIPVYDFNDLPKIEHPFNNEHEDTKKYLGKRAVVGQQYAILKIFIETDIQAKALYDFLDSNEIFIISIPLFGTLQEYIVEYAQDLDMEKIATNWKQSMKVKALGAVAYAIDDSSNSVVDDLGNLVIADAVTNSNKEITYDS
jgi:hypothetical protein